MIRFVTGAFILFQFMQGYDSMQRYAAYVETAKLNEKLVIVKSSANKENNKIIVLLTRIIKLKNLNFAKDD